MNPVIMPPASADHGLEPADDNERTGGTRGPGRRVQASHRQGCLNAAFGAGAEPAITTAVRRAPEELQAESAYMFLGLLFREEYRAQQVLNERLDVAERLPVLIFDLEVQGTVHRDSKIDFLGLLRA